MKKYQLWLERKSYSQHLFNLMKIKHSNHSPDKLDRTIPHLKTPNNENILPLKYKQMEEFHSSAQKLGDISYAITFKQLKNRKMRLMKTFEILNQNMSMARRIKQVKSVFNSGKEKCTTEYGRRKIFQKKCELSNQQLREQNFKTFKKWQNNKVSQHHKYQLTINIQHITKFIHSHDEYAAVWCEISTQKGFVKSQLVKLHRFSGHRFFFALQSQLPKDFIFKLFICKGLNCQMVGQFQLKRPKIGEQNKQDYKSEDHRLDICLSLGYEKIHKEKPSFNLK